MYRFLIFDFLLTLIIIIRVINEHFSESPRRAKMMLSKAPPIIKGYYAYQGLDNVNSNTYAKKMIKIYHMVQEWFKNNCYACQLLDNGDIATNAKFD